LNRITKLVSLNLTKQTIFSGKLRPAEQSDRRLVPDHIPRPDYADHTEGFPISEQRMKGNTYVRQLDAEEIEGQNINNYKQQTL
jgi:hypothetical protein